MNSHILGDIVDINLPVVSNFGGTSSGDNTDEVPLMPEVFLTSHYPKKPNFILIIAGVLLVFFLTKK